VLEAVWKACPADERDYWQGLAQLCVGVTHLQRGNREGAVTLLRRGAGHLTGRLAAWGQTEADRLAAAEPAEQVPLPVLRLRDS
jgi:predicted metal-dependent hydrolase